MTLLMLTAYDVDHGARIQQPLLQFVVCCRDATQDDR